MNSSRNNDDSYSGIRIRKQSSILEDDPHTPPMTETLFRRLDQSQISNVKSRMYLNDSSSSNKK